MFGLQLKIVDKTAAMAAASRRAFLLGIQKAAFEIMTTARSLIVDSPVPSDPGQPIHTRAGRARRAIRYAVDREAYTAVIGPQAKTVGSSMEVHEFGGVRFGRKYPARPFMGPALQRSIDKIPAGFAGEVHA
jgi:hypothetical protein